MPESRESQSVIDLAEQALAAGDYASAEHFLREAARVTEAESGPLSPYLANTLNNLGVVSEMQNNADEAEICYRKAYEIAAATLPPDHPFVATSRKNLSDLCTALGKPVEPEKVQIEAPRVEPDLVAPIPRAEAPVQHPAPATPPPVPQALPRTAASRKFPLAALLVPVFLLALIATIRFWPQPNDRPSGTPPASVLEKPADPIPPSPAVAVTEPAAVKHEPAARIAAPGAPTVLTARLCRTLNRSSSAPDDWPCDRATGPVSAGTLYFYTRLKAARDTEVQHRWYHDNTLFQSVELSLGANQSKGYRTYSRYTIKDGSSGSWRVELRASVGTLLHLEQFVVR